MIILASEDVGLADPHALSVVISCAQAFERIGFPEGNFPLAHACLYLATAPKSNTTMSYFDALKEVEREDAEVPNHLRDASRDAESFGHGEGYVYPHAYRDHWAAQQYLPNSLKGRTFYIPSIIGYEGKIREEVLQKRELQAAVILGDTETGGEFLSWTASAKGKEGWFKRLESGRSALLLGDRETIFAAAQPARHDRVLVPLANDGLLLWESLRRCPEGLTAAIVNSESARDALLSYAHTLDETEKPQIAITQDILPTPKQCENWFSCNEFDHILIRAPRLAIPPTALAAAAKPLLAKNGKVILLSSPPRLGERISRILAQECPALSSKLAQAEEDFFNSAAAAGLWDLQELESAFEQHGFSVEVTLIEQKEERLITEKDIASWFNPAQSRWGTFIAEKLEENEFKALKETLRARITQGPLEWRWKSACLRAAVLN
jgi:putative ATPase